MISSKPRILIVDDERATRELLAEMIGESYRIETVSNDPDALRAVARVRPDLVLLDMSMPGMSGLDVCRPSR